MDNIEGNVQQYEKEDFLKTEIFLMENVIKGHQVVSLKALLEMNSLGDRDLRYQYKLKGGIEK